ncbi:MAG: hypothetical protein ABUT20_50840, partial [Bacteroidota bacterium]
MFSTFDATAMIRFSILIATIVFITATARAQVNLNKETDSLRQLINSAKTYNEQITALLSLAEYFEIKNFDSTISFGQKGIELARKNADSINVAESKRYIGVAWYFKGNYDIAAQNFFESISILEKNPDRNKKGNQKLGL